MKKNLINHIYLNKKTFLTYIENVRVQRCYPIVLVFINTKLSTVFSCTCLCDESQYITRFVYQNFHYELGEQSIIQFQIITSKTKNYSMNY